MKDQGPNGSLWNEADTGRKFVVPKLQAAGNSELLPISDLNLQLSKGFYFNGSRLVSAHGAGAIGLKAWTVTERYTTNALKHPAIFDLGDVNEIIGKFGGEDLLCNVVNQRESLQFAV